MPHVMRGQSRTLLKVSTFSTFAVKRVEMLDDTAMLPFV